MWSSLACWWMRHINHTRQGPFVQAARPNCKARLAPIETCLWDRTDPSAGIELIHPRREGRSRRQLGKKELSNGRWIVGIKLAWLINDQGEVVDWSWDTADAPDNCFRDVALARDGHMITLCDHGFRERGALPRNLKDYDTWDLE
jgi:hypothetical protein